MFQRSRASLIRGITMFLCALLLITPFSRVVHAQGAGDPEPPNIGISGAYLTCGDSGGFGFSYSANREFLFSVTVLDGDSVLPAGDPFVGQAGEFYFPWANQGSVEVQVAAYEADDQAMASPVFADTYQLQCTLDPDPDPVNVEVATPTYGCGSPGSFAFDYTMSGEGTIQIDAEVLNGDTSNVINFGQVSVSGSLSAPAVVLNGTEIIVYSSDPSVGLGAASVPEASVVASCEEVPTVTPTATATETATETETPVAPEPSVVPETPVPTEVPPTPTPITIDITIPEPTGGIWKTPTPITFNLTVPDPTGGISIFEATVSSKPGDRVRVNIAKPGEPPDWEIITIPDPKDGKPFFETKREVNAFIAWLNMTPTIGGLYFHEPPTIKIVPQPPVLIEQKDPKMERAPMSLGNLFSNGDEDDWLSITKQVMTITAVVTVGAVTGGFLVFAYGPWNAVPAGTIFLAAVSQEGVAYEPIFNFFVAPQQEEWYLPPLPAGTYLMKLETLDGQIFQMPFTITDDSTQSLSMQQRDNGSWEIVTEHNSSLEQRVNALPETGTGGQLDQSLWIIGLMVVAAGAASFAIRREGWSQR